MFCNSSRVLFRGIAFCGVAAYVYSRNRKNAVNTRIENIAKINHSAQFSPSLTLTNRSVQDINNFSEKQWQDKLKINLMYAHEALQYTAVALPHEPINYGEDLQGVSSEAIIRMDLMRQETEFVIKRELQPHHNFDKFYEIIADIAKKHKMGNCGEQVVVAYLYLKNEKNLRKIEKLSLVNGDHGFIVIGRDPLSDITKPMTWGKAAVVCDPWGKKYFPAEQLLDQLNQLSQRTLYDPSIHVIGWTSFGSIPPEVTIYRGLRFHEQSHKKQFAEQCIANLTDKDTIYEKMIKSCLLDYIEQKAKPKAPPLLSEWDKQKVESIWSQYLSEKGQ